MSSYQSQMKVPIRPAPPPPLNLKPPPKSTSDWNGFGDTIWTSGSNSNNNKAIGGVQKKKPPPRPPPPKFGNKKSVPSRPSQLIAGLFQKKNNANGKVNEVQANRGGRGDAGGAADSKVAFNGQLLIDFSSPPSSPTFTTRSSSDALSVNSFGSDGMTQWSSSSGNASNVESGFEDDFDAFSNGGSRKLENNFQPRDPWSPPPPKVPEPRIPVPEGKSLSVLPPIGAAKKIPPAMPTIIRSKPEGPRPQARVNGKCDTGRSNVNVLADVFQSVHIGDSRQTEVSRSGFQFEVPVAEEEEEADDSWTSESPPMPTCPPPPPPTFLTALSGGLQEEIVGNDSEPHGIALYDYPGEDPGDLSFKKDDVIYLVQRIDENWLVGRLGRSGAEGSVPANFISVRVPLSGSEGNDGETESELVTALYPFRAETWDDLTFEEGWVIKVTHRIDQDWLYGKCNGKCGQFPANFVDRVPEGLPIRTAQGL